MSDDDKVLCGASTGIEEEMLERFEVPSDQDASDFADLVNRSLDYAELVDRAKDTCAHDRRYIDREYAYRCKDCGKQINQGKGYRETMSDYEEGVEFGRHQRIGYLSKAARHSALMEFRKILVEMTQDRKPSREVYDPSLLGPSLLAAAEGEVEGIHMCIDALDDFMGENDE